MKLGVEADEKSSATEANCTIFDTEMNEQWVPSSRTAVAIEK
jgi:hypothetical protein